MRKTKENASMAKKKIMNAEIVPTVSTVQDISGRDNSSYRTLGLLHGDTVTWFWIGTHDEYEQILKRMQ